MDQVKNAKVTEDSCDYAVGAGGPSLSRSVMGGHTGLVVPIPGMFAMETRRDLRKGGNVSTGTTYFFISSYFAPSLTDQI